MKNYLFLLVVALFLPFSNSAQSLLGDWHCAAYDVGLHLNLDGTFYTSTAAAGYSTSKGEFSISEGHLWLSDESGNVSVYKVVGLTQTEMIVADAAGNPFTYQRVGYVPTFIPVPWEAEEHQKALARTGSHSLLDSHLQAYIAFAEFLASTSITITEKALIEKQLRSDFESNPAKTVAEAEAFQGAFRQVFELIDASQISIARKALFSQLYFTSQGLPDDQNSLLVVIQRYVKVVATDPINYLILTEKDVNAFANYVQFNQRLQGVSTEPTAAEVEEFKSYVISNFTRFVPAERKLLSNVGTLWDYVQANWRQMNKAQQEQWRKTYQQRTQPSAETESSWTIPENASSAEVEAQRQDLATDHFMLKAMNDMSLRNHATMMNVIAEMGGGDNYWEVTSHPW